MSASFGSSSSKNKSASSNASNFSQNVWGGSDQGAALQNLYNNASQLFGNTYNNQLGQMNQGADFMNQTAGTASQGWQDQLAGGAYAGVSTQDALNNINNINQSMASPSNTQQIYAQMMGGQGNNYADAMKNQYLADANKAQANMLNNLDQRASGIGASGSSRQGIAQGIGMEDINKNLQYNLAKTGYDTFDQDLTNKLNIAQAADSNNVTRQQMVTDSLGSMLTGAQGASAGAVNNSQNIAGMGANAANLYNTPWDALSQYTNAIGQPTVLSSGVSTALSSGTGKSSGTSASGGCFITAAACQQLGKTNDCYELNLLRTYRDEWLAYQPDGKKLVQEYYSIAPKIVDAIDDLPAPKKVYEALWYDYIIPCIQLIESNEMYKAKDKYCEMVQALVVLL
jgi:hypothetical protein